MKFLGLFISFCAKLFSSIHKKRSAFKLNSFGDHRRIYLLSILVIWQVFCNVVLAPRHLERIQLCLSVQLRKVLREQFITNTLIAFIANAKKNAIWVEIKAVFLDLELKTGLDYDVKFA